MSEMYEFLAELGQYYEVGGRHDLLWRVPERDGTFDAYRILVSEVMLQQTQVPRVVPKYQAFLNQFPRVQSLATAPLGDVLIAWQGLGYNRRAKYLWQAAQTVITEYIGALPASLSELVTLPGIGSNTAGAILTYTYNQPLAFIETNIRTVYIHHFFAGQTTVTDKEIINQLERTLQVLADENEWFMIDSVVSYRDFYWALMDYGTHLKNMVGNVARASKTYAKQSKFEGSRRQLRGMVLRELAASEQTVEQLRVVLDDPRALSVLDDLTREGLIRSDGQRYGLA